MVTSYRQRPALQYLLMQTSTTLSTRCQMIGAALPRQSTLLSTEDPWYKYQPLDLSDGSIRLIKVNHRYDSRGRPEHTFNLVHSNVSHVPYIALSYTWGLQQAGVSIVLNRKVLVVRRNVASFLRAVTTKFRNHFVNGTYIWIDAICIDQESTEERNHQVRQMGRIYSSAQSVAIWLECGELISQHEEQVREFWLRVTSPDFTRSDVGQMTTRSLSQSVVSLFVASFACLEV